MRLTAPSNQLDAFNTGLQRATTMGYDAVDNLSASIDPLGYPTAYNYDADSTGEVCHKEPGRRPGHNGLRRGR